MGKPWNGDYVNATGDLIGDLTHNFFLETGARNNKLKVYEAVDHPAARALTGYLLVRGGVHQVAYARALENLTGAKMEKLFPTPRIPTDKIPECQPHIKRGEHLKLYRWSPDDFKELSAVFNGPHPETGEELEVAEELHPEGAPAYDLPPQEAALRARSRRRGDRGDRAEAAGRRRACRKSRPASSPRERQSRESQESRESQSEKMNRPELLGIYLNDHLAGSIGGVETARRARGCNEGTEFGAAAWLRSARKSSPIASRSKR